MLLLIANDGPLGPEWLDHPLILSSAAEADRVWQADARSKLENWRQDYNYFRPHSALRH